MPESSAAMEEHGMTPRQIRIVLTLAGLTCCLVAPAAGVEVAIVKVAPPAAMPAVLAIGSTSFMGQVGANMAALPAASDSWAALSTVQPDGGGPPADDTLVWFSAPGMVPEPSTPALWLIGLAVLGWVVRQRR